MYAGIKYDNLKKILMQMSLILSRAQSVKLKFYALS